MRAKDNFIRTENQLPDETGSLVRSLIDFE